MQNIGSQWLIGLPIYDNLLKAPKCAPGMLNPVRVDVWEA